MMRMFSAMLLGLLAIAMLPGCAGMMGSERRDTNAEVILDLLWLGERRARPMWVTL